MPNADEQQRRLPGPWRLVSAAVLLVLAAVVLWTTVSYGSPGHDSSSAEDTPSAGTAPSAGASDGGEGADSPLASAPGPSISVSVSASPVAAISVSPATVTITTPPPGTAAKPATKAAATAKATTAAAAAAATTPAFTPITLQAEGGDLTGGAESTSCPTCGGGARVRYISGTSEVTVHGTATAAGSRTVTVIFETDGQRTLNVSINGGSPVALTVTGTSWVDPLSVSFRATVPAGALSLRFFNADGPAPDVDAVTVG